MQTATSTKHQYLDTINHTDKSKHISMRHILINMKYDMATQNQSNISQIDQKKKNFSLSETTILTLSVNHKEPKHIYYGYEIFQTKKVR